MKNFKLATLPTLVIMALSGCEDKAPTTADLHRPWTKNGIVDQI